MSTINILYGSTTGNTREAAQAIAAKLGGTPINVAQATAADFKADLLILGTSTWGLGDLQDDWAAKLPLLQAAPLSGCKVALFGLGDALGFGQTFLNGMADLAAAAQAAGATLVGAWSAAGYQHDASTAQHGDHFIGLALDDDNQADQTASRIDAWCAQLKTQL